MRRRQAAVARECLTKRLDTRARRLARALASLAATLVVPVTPLLSAQAPRTQASPPRIPLARGLTIVQTLHMPDGDRESILAVEDASPAGVRYVWRGLEVRADGDTARFEHTRVARAADLAGATRLHIFFDPTGPRDTPGYTTWSLSTAVYRQLRAEGSAPISILSMEPPSGAGAALAGFAFGGARQVPVRWTGTLTRVSAAPEPFPLLVDGRRVVVPALRLRGEFAARARRWQPELWVLADSAHPLLLKWVGAFQQTGNVLQTVRVEHPASVAGAEGATGSIERLLDTACRVELPGIYFGFNSAALDPASERTIGSLGDVLARRPAWNVTIEGHTDSIGSAAANRALSERRAEAVRGRLVTGHRVSGARVRAQGHGASRPRESNATIEGRARNRRVELVRECSGAGR